jgi:hypothetical protein
MHTVLADRIRAIRSCRRCQWRIGKRSNVRDACTHPTLPSVLDQDFGKAILRLALDLQDVIFPGTTFISTRIPSCAARGCACPPHPRRRSYSAQGIFSRPPSYIVQRYGFTTDPASKASGLDEPRVAEMQENGSSYCQQGAAFSAGACYPVDYSSLASDHNAERLNFFRR